MVKPEPTFEEVLHRLEAVVGQLEQGEQPLEKALDLFEEGVRLSRILTTRLEEAQARIDKVVLGKSQAPVIEPFEPSPEEEAK